MCGIAGFIDFRNQSSEEVLRSATDILAHRGPDGSGYTFTQLEYCQIGLGHRRLSIIDLSNAASQPMIYKHFSIVFNGEIYNYEEIKNLLIQKGHQFDTHSDTEVILHAWEEWGVAMINHFIGMFAFVIYDALKKELTCFRDRAGVKPFYYYWHEGLFLFSSELKSFHQHPGFKKQINKQAIHQYFQYGYIMAPLSIFEYTHKLVPGHYLKFSIEQQSFSVNKYWDVFDAYNKPKLQISESEAKSRLHELLISACNYRMVADVPVGVFLSGGYDSTAVTALIQSQQKEKLKTFTIGFHEEDHNEAEFAKQVASHLQTDHTEYYCTTKEAQDIIPTIPFYCDEPFGDSSIIPTTLVSQLARKQVTVALSADAGDEIFAGYPKYTQTVNFLNNINLLPSLLRKPASHIFAAIPDSWLIAMTGNKAVTIKKQRFVELLQKKNLSSNDLMDVLFSQVYTNQQLKDLLAEDTQQPASFFTTRDLLRDDLGSLDKILAVDYKTYMVDDILCKVDRAGMSTSLEGREPLLDHRIVEFAAQIPESYKVKGDSRKHLLKEIVHEYVPKSMMDRPKMGFAVPVAHWLKSDLKYYKDEFMTEKDFAEHGLFKQSGVNHIINQFYKGDRNYNGLFWYLLMFQMWYKKWML
jgi:asparagine synthase (glutamine-hydrolysing)